MICVGEGYEITSAGIRKIENYGMQPKEDNPYVLFTHYEPEVPSIDGLKSLLEYTQNRVRETELEFPNDELVRVSRRYFGLRIRST